MRLRRRSLLFAAILSLGCFGLAVAAFQASIADELVEIPGTRVSLVPPEGFELSERRPYLRSDVAMGWIEVYETWFYGFAEISELLQVDRPQGGLVITGRHEVTLQGYSGFVAWGRIETSGTIHDIWALALSDEDFALVLKVTATVPESLSDEAVLAAFETVQIRSIEDFDLRERLGYRFQEAGTFEVFLIERDKFVTLKSKEEENAQFKIEVAPKFRCGPPDDAVIAFSKTEVQSISFVSVREIGEPAEIAVDGLPGVEYLADGVDQRTEAELAVYHAALSDRCEYYRFIGYAPRDERDRYIADFRRMTESFARKQ